MIDFHNHILPNIDDGSNSIRTSLNMIRKARDQGITDIVNTAHYKHPKMDGTEINYKVVYDSTKKLQKVLYENDINVKIHIGAETFFHDGLDKLIEDKLATFGHGKYILIELKLDKKL